MPVGSADPLLPYWSLVAGQPALEVQPVQFGIRGNGEAGVGKQEPAQDGGPVPSVAVVDLQRQRVDAAHLGSLDEFVQASPERLLLFSFTRLVR